MKIAVARPISGLDKMEEGIADFEHAIKEYEDSGGEKYDPAMKKNDLLQVLPGELSELMLWMATDQGKNFQEFKEHIIVMSGKILFNKRKSPLHSVAPGEQASAAAVPQQDDGGDAELMAALNTADPEEMLQAVMKWKGKFNRGGGGGGGARRPRDDRRAAPKVGDRPQRRCPNCGEQHEKKDCTKPQVAFKDRLCWTCGGKDHTSAQCTKGKGPIKAIEDGPIKAVAEIIEKMKLNGCFAVTNDDGYVAANPRRKSRPMPIQNTLASYLSPTQWDVLRNTDVEKDDDDTGTAIEKLKARVAVSLRSPGDALPGASLGAGVTSAGGTRGWPTLPSRDPSERGAFSQCQGGMEDHAELLKQKKTVMATKAGLQKPGLHGYTVPLVSVLTRLQPKPDISQSTILKNYTIGSSYPAASITTTNATIPSSTAPSAGVPTTGVRNPLH